MASSSDEVEGTPPGATGGLLEPLDPPNQSLPGVPNILRTMLLS